MKRELPDEKERKSITLNSNESKKIEDISLKTTIFLNIVNSKFVAKFKKKKENQFYSDYCEIIYLPALYVDVLRRIIIIMYEKSNDPIAYGYMSKDNLKYTMEYVMEMYNDVEEKKEKLIKKSAFIFYNIALKHPFSDGNKRTAIIVCNAFLE